MVKMSSKYTNTIIIALSDYYFDGDGISNDQSVYQSSQLLKISDYFRAIKGYFVWNHSALNLYMTDNWKLRLEGSHVIIICGDHVSSIIMKCFFNEMKKLNIYRVKKFTFLYGDFISSLDKADFWQSLDGDEKYKFMHYDPAPTCYDRSNIVNLPILDYSVLGFQEKLYQCISEENYEIGWEDEYVGEV